MERSSEGVMPERESCKGATTHRGQEQHIIDKRRWRESNACAIEGGEKREC
ncbi:uncharacterized protein DS421_10g298530 [Arachis hypogaea]|nr:uncharacterized protein DS421_10g298530 [Arachis hypogaea]